MVTRRTPAAKKVAAKTPVKVAAKKAAKVATKKVSTAADIPTITMEYVPISTLQGYDYNPRINDHVVDKLAEGIKEHGFVVPCVVDKNGVLVTGHTRIKAATKLGMEQVPVIRADHLTPAQAKAFRLFDNKISELAEWDMELLSSEIQQLSAVGYDVGNLGWTEAELDCLTNIVADDCLSTTDLLDEPEAERTRATQRRAPTNVRLVIGDIVFFVDAQRYRSWADGLRQLCDFEEEAVVDELRRRLRIE